MQLVSLSPVNAFVTACDRPKTDATWLVLVGELLRIALNLLSASVANKTVAFQCATRVFIYSKVAQIGKV